MYQKYHIKWPLTPRQVENLDEMLSTLFTEVTRLRQAISTFTSTSVTSESSLSAPMTCDCPNSGESDWYQPVQNTIIPSQVIDGNLTVNTPDFGGLTIHAAGSDHTAFEMNNSGGAGLQIFTNGASAAATLAQFFVGGGVAVNLTPSASTYAPGGWAFAQRISAPVVKIIANSYANTITAIGAGAQEGMTVGVTDSNTNVWGATVASGGTNHVLAYYNGTNWTVAAK